MDAIPFDLSQAQIESIFGRYYEPEYDLQGLEGIAKKAIRHDPNLITIYHAGAIDLPKDKRDKNWILARDSVLESVIQKLELGKEYQAVPPFSGTNNMLAILCGVTDHINPGEIYYPEFDTANFSNGSHSKLRRVFWDSNAVLLNLSNLIVFDLHNTNTTGTYV
ncbi:hypothetical protein JXC34_04700, partial [Candidatus Woesearchaeota archaeon]|nr:hypothetical protein [Candidatus Woesearchaeota archaeon]